MSGYNNICKFIDHSGPKSSTHFSSGPPCFFSAIQGVLTLFLPFSPSLRKNVLDMRVH